jgi:hypothetical protein
MWISFRVVDAWVGIFMAIASLVLFPLTTIVLPILMFFIPSTEAGPLALWPGIVAASIFEGLARRNGANR